MSLTERDRLIWLQGLKKINSRGVDIRIDNVVCPEENFDMLLGSPDSPSYYKLCAVKDATTGEVVCFNFVLED